MEDLDELQITTFKAIDVLKSLRENRLFHDGKLYREKMRLDDTIAELIDLVKTINIKIKY